MGTLLRHHISGATSKMGGDGFKEFNTKKLIKVLLSSWDFLTVILELNVIFI